MNFRVKNPGLIVDCTELVVLFLLGFNEVVVAVPAVIKILDVLDFYYFILG